MGQRLDNMEVVLPGIRDAHLNVHGGPALDEDSHQAHLQPLSCPVEDSAPLSVLGFHCLGQCWRWDNIFQWGGGGGLGRFYKSKDNNSSRQIIIYFTTKE